MRKVEYTIAIKDENGDILSKTSYSKECDIPLQDEIDRHTYLGLLNDVELWIKKGQISMDIEEYGHEVKAHSAA